MPMAERLARDNPHATPSDRCLICTQAWWGWSASRAAASGADRELGVPIEDVAVPDAIRRADLAVAAITALADDAPAQRREAPAPAAPTPAHLQPALGCSPTTAAYVHHPSPKAT